MTLLEKAFLEIEGETDTAVFELHIGLEQESSIAKSYLMGERGQYIREVVNQTPNTGNVDEERRTGFWIDGGGGNWEVSLSFETGLDDVQWGDGTGGTGPENVTPTDASGPDVYPTSRRQILNYWIAKTKSDSGGNTRIHTGEWTDGSYGEDGAFGEPMPVAIRETNLSDPQTENGPTTMSGSLTMSHVALWGGSEAPQWAQDAIGAALQAADFIPDE